MLSEKIGESNGKITTQRVLPSEGSGPKIEVSFQSQGKVLGVEINEIGTYWSVVREGGVIYGEGQGVYMTKDGDAVSWKGSGVGRATGKGMGASYRGSLFFQTTSQKLSKLNAICGVFEFDVDAEGNTHAILSEWR